MNAPLHSPLNLQLGCNVHSRFTLLLSLPHPFLPRSPSVLRPPKGFFLLFPILFSQFSKHESRLRLLYPLKECNTILYNHHSPFPFPQRLHYISIRVCLLCVRVCVW
jgi:hypothetical protein